MLDLIFSGFLKALFSTGVLFSLSTFVFGQSSDDLNKIVALQQVQIRELQDLISKAIKCDTNTAKCDWIGNQAGLKGDQGPRGATGATGARGAPGARGAKGSFSSCTVRSGGEGGASCQSNEVVTGGAVHCPQGGVTDGFKIVGNSVRPQGTKCWGDRVGYAYAVQVQAICCLK